jgi:hypothetical protein
MLYFQILSYHNILDLQYYFISSNNTVFNHIASLNRQQCSGSDKTYFRGFAQGEVEGLLVSKSGDNNVERREGPFAAEDETTEGEEV